MIDAIASQTKHCMKEIVRNTEVITSNITEGAGTNGSNLMDIEIGEEEWEEGSECFDKCFDDEVLYLRQKIKRELSLDQTKKRKFTVVYHHGKLNFLSYNYQFPLMNCYHLIVTWLIGSVSQNLLPLWTFISKEVKHINNGMRMWNMMKFFMSKLKRVYIEKVCQKSKMKDWDYISAINFWDNVQNYFNKKYMANNKRKENSWKKVYNIIASSNIFQNPNNSLSK